MESTAPSRPPSSSPQPRPLGGAVSERAALPDMGILLGAPRTAVPRPVRGEEGRGEETPSRRPSRRVRRGERDSERASGAMVGVVVRRGSGRWDTSEGEGEPTRRGETRPRWLWGFEMGSTTGRSAATLRKGEERWAPPGPKGCSAAPIPPSSSSASGLRSEHFSPYFLFHSFPPLPRILSAEQQQPPCRGRRGGWGAQPNPV